MAMVRARRSADHLFPKMNSQQAQSLVEAFGEAIDEIAKGAVLNPFPEKIPDSFEKALKPFVTTCISVLKDKTANPKKSPLQFMTALTRSNFERWKDPPRRSSEGY